MTKKKICMITTRHLPGDPRIFEKESRSLREMGFSVEIVVPVGKLPENKHGVTFRTFQKKQGPLRKINTLLETYMASKAADADVYHCHEIDASLFIGYLLKKRAKHKNVKLIFDCHEFWLGYFSSRVPRFVRWLFQAVFIMYEKFIIKHCDAIITANSIERSYYQILFPTKEIQIIYNTPHLVESKLPKPIEKQYDLCFEGVLNFVRGEKILFELIKKFKEDDQDIKLLVVGKIQEGACQQWADDYIEQHDLQENIIFTGWQRYDKINSFLSQCKIGIFLYQHSTNNLLAGPPNKLFNFMKAGLPIVAPDLPETKSILSEIGCGLTVTPHDLSDIENAVRKLLDSPKLCNEMSAKGKTAYKERFNWRIEKEKLQKIYEKILK